LTAIAAWVACRTAKTAEKIAGRSVDATERQTAIAAFQEILKDYSDPQMYKSLRTFGRFVADDPDRKGRFTRITTYFCDHNFELGPDVTTQDDFKWLVRKLEEDPEVGAARRQMHHHYKRVWALRRAGVISDGGGLLFLLTEATTGYSLWRNEVLPATIALGLFQRERGRSSSPGERWPYELLDWADRAKQKA